MFTDFRDNGGAQRNIDVTLACVAQWTERGLQTKGWPVQFPVQAQAWVAGQVPSGVCVRGNHTLMFLSLSPSLTLSLNKSLKINK